MLTIFKSPAGADVIMLGPTAQAMFKALDRDPDSPSGIVTVEQLPGAIARLKQAMAADKAAHAGEEPDEEQAPRGMAAPVSFYQRAWPLLELLELALKEQKPVTWGV